MPSLVVLHVMPVCLRLRLVDFLFSRSDAFHHRELVLHTLLFGSRSGPDGVRHPPDMRLLVLVIELGVKRIMRNCRCAVQHGLQSLSQHIADGSGAAGIGQPVSNSCESHTHAPKPVPAARPERWVLDGTKYM